VLRSLRSASLRGWPHPQPLPLRRRLRAAHPNGFTLPLATVTALVMVVSSSSLLGMALAGRQAQLAELRRRQAEDVLLSAGRQVVEQLQTTHQPLLQSWPQPPAAWPVPQPATTPLGSLHLTALQPTASAALLTLELRDASGRARTARFRARRDPSNGAIVNLRLEGA